MRIIAGEYKGRRLESPADQTIRPTADKVKEALFSILHPVIYGARVCDLFAGTGNLGLEALSRGAARCWFGDQSMSSIRLIHANVEKCGAQEQAEVIRGDYRKVLSRLPEPVDIFFLDPPYGKGLLEKAASMIKELALLSEDGILVCEHRRDEVLPETLAGFQKYKERAYGKVVLSFYI